MNQRPDPRAAALAFLAAITPGAATALLVLAKLTGLTSWSWPRVLTPLWVPALAGLGAVLVLRATAPVRRASQPGPRGWPR